MKSSKEYSKDYERMRSFDIMCYIDYMYDKYGGAKEVAAELGIERGELFRMTGRCQASIYAHWRTNFYDKGHKKIFTYGQPPKME